MTTATAMNRRYARALPPGDLLTFAITPLDSANVPVWTALYFSAGTSRWTTAVPNAQGYGATDADAERGALGELHEFVQADRALASVARERGSYRELARRAGAAHVVHPVACIVSAGSTIDDATPLEWVAATRYATRERVWIPAEIAAVAATDLAPGYEPFAVPLTNGLGAGPSLEWALAHGLLELLQRDGNGTRFRALDAGVALDLHGVTDPVSLELLARYRAAGIDVLAKFASDDFGIANVYVVGAEPGEAPGSQPLAVTACGEAASPDRETALRKALLEFGAARARKAFSHGPLADVARIGPPGYVERVRAKFDPAAQESRALHAMLAWLRSSRAELRALLEPNVLRVRERIAFDTLPRWHAPPDEPVPGAALCATLATRLADGGLDVLYVDCSPPDAAESGVYAVKAVVPGLEVETMSYHRIGERNARKLLAADSDLVRRGGRPPYGERVRLSPEAEERLGGPVWFDIDAVSRAIGALYPLYREPEIHTAALALEALGR